MNEELQKGMKCQTFLTYYFCCCKTYSQNLRVILKESIINSRFYINRNQQNCGYDV